MGSAAPVRATQEGQGVRHSSPERQLTRLRHCRSPPRGCGPPAPAIAAREVADQGVGDRAYELRARRDDAVKAMPRARSERSRGASASPWFSIV